LKKVFIIALAFVLIIFGFIFSKSKQAAWEDASLVATEALTEKNTGTRVYSFSGSDEIVTVMNGTVVIEEDEETFSGGILKINSEEFFENAVSCSTSFYVLDNGEEKNVMTNRIIDKTGGNVVLDGDDLGKMSGPDAVTGYDNDSAEKLMKNLFFEIKIVNADGEEKSHQLQLEVVEVN